MPDQVIESAVDDATIDKIVRLLCNVQDRATVVAACLEKLGLDPDHVDAAIEAAVEKVTRAAHFHRDHELGKALTRLNQCYQKAVTIQDTKTAIAAQRELNRLLGLGTPGSIGPESAPSGESGESADPDARRIENEHLANLVAAVETHLEPLGLSDSLEDTDADLVRLAAERIRVLESPRTQKRTSKNRSRKSAKRKKRQKRKGS